jgi:phosphocarrier protein HPr
MFSRTLIIRNPNGIHARHARLFVQAALACPALVRLRKGEKVVNGKSLLGTLTLGMKCHDTVTLETDTEDEQVLDRLERILTQPSEEPVPK